MKQEIFYRQTKLNYTEQELLRYEPHAYQRYATEFILAHPVAGLLLDMGLGKTVITLTAVKELLQRREVRRVLVVAPLRVARDQWPAELHKWEHLQGLRYVVAVGNRAQRLAALKNREAQVVIINRENVEWLVTSGLFDFDMMVLDEMSSFKCCQTRRFKALLRVRPKVKRVVGLTGTPAGNGLMDLWAQFRLLDMGARLGRHIDLYRHRYFEPSRRGKGGKVYSYTPWPGAEQAIYQRISDITISMASRDYLQLPECVMAERTVRLSAGERQHYETLKRELALQVKEQEIDVTSASALSVKLLQLASGTVYDNEGRRVVIHDRKLDALEDLLEAANGRPLLVAYWFKHDKERILARLPGRELRSSQDIEDWNAGKIPLALIHPASAGHGLNLQQGGGLLVWFSLPWSLELYQQTNARLYRQGQEGTVVIQHIVAEDTIDEDVLQALRNKEATQEALLQAVRARLQEKGGF